MATDIAIREYHWNIKRQSRVRREVYSTGSDERPSSQPKSHFKGLIYPDSFYFVELSMFSTLYKLLSVGSKNKNSTSAKNIIINISFTFLWLLFD